MSDIFTTAGNPVKSIYVLGDAGSGKSSFCKSLVNCWCMAHSRESTAEDEFDGIKEMKKFEFLLYISLRRFKDVVSIQEMLEKQYKIKSLNEILNNESRNIIIVLDGLDEWSSKTVTSNQFQTEGLPERDISKDYTVITTSRPWKIETLGITDKEIEQRLNLKGFDELAVKTMIEKTVSVLNSSFAENKSPSACEDKLNRDAIASMKKVPIMLLQLICLWFDDKLQVSSICAVYSAMLELFFSWNDKKQLNEEEDRLFRKMREKSKDLPNIELPQYLKNSKLCKLYKYLIHELSRLAYKTLITNEKEASLTFESSLFEEFEISDEVKACSLKLGILSEDGCPSLYASTSESSLLSFVHKSVQEYLAAMYIAIKYKAHIMSSTDSENTDFNGHCELLFKEVFSNCTTLDETLEQANIFITLCGLEPRIATSISKYIYDIVTRDTRVLEYRRTIDDNYRHKSLISNIQECILNCTEEVQACHTNILSNFYVGDIIAERKSLCDNFFTCIDKQYISPGSVRSFSVDAYRVDVSLKAVFGYLPKCQRLETIHIDASFGSYKIDDEDIKCICSGIEENTSTLKSLYVGFKKNDHLKSMYKTIVRHLPEMSHLVALHIQGFSLPYTDFTKLCNFLSCNSRLKQISIFNTQYQLNTDVFSKYCPNWGTKFIGLCNVLPCYIPFKHISIFNRQYQPNTHLFCGCYPYIWHTDKRIFSKGMVFLKNRKRHEVDLYENQELQYLKYNNPVLVTRVNTSNLEFFSYKSLNNQNCSKVFNDISSAKTLTQLELEYNSFDGIFDETQKLIKVLPLLQQLRELTLLKFSFTDNIIKSPSKMKSMKIINLMDVRMSLTTWQQFVDSLPIIPLPVKVGVWRMYITSEWPVCSNRYTQTNEAAQQYVRKQEELFNMVRESKNSIYISTKK